MSERAIERVAEQLSLTEITEECAVNGVHYLIGCYQAPTGFYVVSCSCGFRIDTGKSAGNAHALLRAHYAGHASLADVQGA